MRGWLLFILTLCVVTVSWAQPSTGRRRAAEFAEQGAEAMIAGEYARAANYYRLARKNDRKQPNYLVEEARAHFLNQDYREVIALTQPALRREKGRWEGKVTAYRLYGSALDMLEKQKSARKVFEKGRKEFPKEGAFFLELGLLEWGVGNDRLALEYWEQGIRTVPDYPDNYWMAARHLRERGHFAWAIIYLEQFLNLERYTPRTRKASRLLWSCYQEAYVCDGECKFRFFQSSESDFSRGLAQAMDIVYSPEVASRQPGLQLQDIYLAHLEASELMPGRAGPAEPYFSWLTELVRSGHLEAYDHWLLQDGEPDAFTQWLREHSGEFEAFEDWLVRHSLLQFTRKPVTRPILTPSN